MILPVGANASSFGFAQGPVVLKTSTTCWGSSGCAEGTSAEIVAVLPDEAVLFWVLRWVVTAGEMRLVCYVQLTGVFLSLSGIDPVDTEPIRPGTALAICSAPEKERL